MALLTMEIFSDHSGLVKMANSCLEPIRYFFNDSTQAVVITENGASFFSYKQAEHHWFKTAKMIAAFIPGVVIGSILRLYMLYFEKSLNIPDLKKKHDIEEKKIKKNIEKDSEVNKRLNESFEEYGKKTFFPALKIVENTIKDQENIWDDPHFIESVSQAMKTGFIYMQLFFRDLFQECKNDVDQMAKKLIDQSQEKDWAHRFFKFPILYYMARFRAIYWDRDTIEKYHCQFYAIKDQSMIDQFLNNENYIRIRKVRIQKRYEGKSTIELCSKLYTMKNLENFPVISGEEFFETIAVSKADVAPFFNPKTPQYIWRAYFNAFCELVNQNGLWEKIQDPRFKKWSQPDHESKVGEIPHCPDTTPT